MAKSKPFTLDLIQGSVDAAAAEAEAGRPRGTFLWPIDKIEILDGYNIRDGLDKDHVRFLADSMKANGYMPDKPISGFVAKAEDGSNILYAIAGHHRTAAVELANSELPDDKQIDKIPVIVKPKTTSMRDLTIDLYVSNTGKPLTVVETANLCKRLLDDGMTEAEIATSLGFKTGKKYVTHLLSVLSAPKEVREMISSGKVSATTAIKALKTGDTKEVVKKMKAEVKTAEKTGKKKVTAKNLKADKHVDDELVDELAKSLKAHLADKRKDGKSGWNDPKQCTPGRLLAGADRRAKGGMLIDQIAYLGMLRYRGVTGDDIQAMRGETSAAEEGDLV